MKKLEEQTKLMRRADSFGLMAFVTAGIVVFAGLITTEIGFIHTRSFSYSSHLPTLNEGWFWVADFFLHSLPYGVVIVALALLIKAMVSCSSSRQWWMARLEPSFTRTVLFFTRVTIVFAWICLAVSSFASSWGVVHEISLWTIWYISPSRYVFFLNLAMCFIDGVKVFGVLYLGAMATRTLVLICREKAQDES